MANGKCAVVSKHAAIPGPTPPYSFTHVHNENGGEDESSSKESTILQITLRGGTKVEMISHRVVIIPVWMVILPQWVVMLPHWVVMLPPWADLQGG